MTIDEFAKIDLRVGAVRSVERVEGSEKLLKLMIDIGEESPRQVLAGLGKQYEPEMLLDKSVIVVANLEPKELMGMESQGMVLAASGENGPVVLVPDGDAAPGAKIT